MGLLPGLEDALLAKFENFGIKFFECAIKLKMAAFYWNFSIISIKVRSEGV
jgi:hypothetical protein